MAEATIQSPAHLSKPLPEPPLKHNEIATKEEIIASPVLTTAPMIQRRMTELPVLEGQHPRVKRPWGSKNVVIAIPLGPKIGEGLGKRLLPLTKEEFKARIKSFQEQGLSTTGFDVDQASVDGTETGPQSRELAPLEYDLKLTKTNTRVSIPDNVEWEQYVQFLREEKLRALGVTSGDDEPSSVMSPSASSMGHVASPLRAFSPAFPPSSTNSNLNGPLINAFSPSFIPTTSTNPSSHVPSIASPVSIGAGFHNPRQSISVAGDSKSGSPFQFLLQQSPPPIGGMWSPQQLINAQGLPRGGSPAVLQSMPAVLSAASFSPSTFSPDAVPFQANDFFSHGGQTLQNGYVSGGYDQRFESLNAKDAESSATSNHAPEIATPIPGHRHNLSLTLQKEIDEAERQVEEEEAAKEKDDSAPVTEEKVQEPVSTVLDRAEEPTPNSQRISTEKGEELDRSVDAEKPKESVPTPVKPRAVSGLGASRFAMAEPKQPELAPKVEANAEVAKPEEKEIPIANLVNVEDKLEEFLGNPPVQTKEATSESQFDEFAAPPHAEPSLYSSSRAAKADEVNEQNDSQKLEAEATAKKNSKLNVNAAEFKFDPTTTFDPSSFSFDNDSLASNVFSQNRRVVSGPSSGPTNRFNAAAAPFQPSFSRSFTQPVVIPPPQSARSMTLPSSEFSFLSGGPKFNPDAPSFTPLGSVAIPSPSFTLSPATGHMPIFNFSSLPQNGDNIKLPKKNKAVPIKKPTTPTGSESEDESFDEADRLKQPDGRQKRARSGGDDGDSVPQFAVPSHPLTDEGFAKAEERKPLAEVSNAQDNASKQPEMLLATPDKLTIRPGELSRPRSILEMSPDYDGKGWDSPVASPQEPFKLADKLQHLSDDLPEEFGIYQGDGDSERAMEDLEALKAELSMSTLLNADEGEPSILEDPITPKAHPLRSRLNATAPAFEFPPDNTPFTSTPVQSSPALVQESSPSLPVESTPVRKFSGLAGSRFAHSPPTSAESSPMIREPEKSVPDVRATQDTPISTNEPPTETESLKINDTPASEPRSDLFDEVISELPTSSPLPAFNADLMRSDAPSPSPHKTALSHRPVDKTIAEIIPTSPIRNGSVVRHSSPPAVPYSTGLLPTSDWDDTLPETNTLQGKVLDGKINDLVGKLLQKRLAPLESSLSSIQHLLTTSAALSGNDRKSRSASAEVEHSDADDEDDHEHGQRRSISPRKDHRLDRIRTVVQEALATHQPPSHASIHDERFAAMQQTLDELRSTMVRSPTSPKMSEGAIGTIEQLRSRIISLEKGLRDAEDRAIKEQVSCNIATKRVAEFEGKLEIALDEVARQREIADDKTSKLRQFDERQHQQLSQAKMRATVLETTNENLQKMKTDLETRNSAVNAKLRDLEISSERWKHEVDTMSLENMELRRTLDSKNSKVNESVRVLDGMKVKFEATQDELGKIRSDFAKEQATWHQRNIEQGSRIEILEARLEAEAKTRERFEKEMERLEERERDAMRLKVELDQVKRNNANLEELMQSLRKENLEFQRLSDKHQRDASEAKDAGAVEVRRTKTLLQAEIEAANSQVKILRDSLEGEVSRLSADLSRAHRDADLQKERHDDVLHDITNAKVEAVQAANEAAQQAMLEVKANHAKELETHKADHQRALQAHGAEIEKIKAEHELHLQGHTDNLEKAKGEHLRELQASFEDRERNEGTLNERLGLANVKAEQLQDRVNHLEEQLEIAKSAARAAAQAATSKNLSPEAAVIVRKSELPEKISPQALRESIMVLQEQLQEREGRIESLEDDLSKVDRDAPKKLSEKDNEIAWLRELLGVRVNELEDIVQLLSTEGFDRISVRDSVIRLKANIEMEQQERERAMAGGLVLPSLPSLSNFASPKSVLPLAAALGNWRKGRDAAVERVSGMMSGNSDTPSRSPAASASSFLSGLLTPPASNLRQSPSPSHAVSSKAKRNTSGESRKSKSKHKSKHGHHSKNTHADAEPSTPPLMQPSSYDMDAQAGLPLPLDISLDGSPSRAGPSTLPTTENENPSEPPLEV